MIESPPADANPIALIIEDETDLAFIFATALARAGFDTTIEYDGQAAIEKLATIVPSVLVLDLHLPSVSGEAILRQIQGDDRFAHTRIIVASADPNWAEKLRDDVDLILEKPISFEQLRDLAIRLRPAATGSA